MSAARHVVVAGVLIFSAFTSSLARAEPDSYDIPRGDESLAESPTVHARIRDATLRSATVFAHGTKEQSLVQVCRLPCEVDLPVGTKLQIAFDDPRTSPKEFEIEGSAGSVIEVITSYTEAEDIAGTVLVSVGGVVTGLGGIATALMLGSSFFKGNQVMIGGAITAGGASLLALGLYFLIHDARGTSVEQETQKAARMIEQISGTFVF